jgi:hypothetical protein
MDKSLNIKRPYFKKRGYNQVIDNSFNTLKPAQTPESVSDFFQRFQDLLLFLSDEQLSQFFRGSLPFARSFKGSFSDEVDRLNDLTGSLKEDEENRERGFESDEHPIIPNGTFLQHYNNGTMSYYYMQRGLLRKFDKQSTFESLFKSITSLDPTKPDDLINNVPYVDYRDFTRFYQSSVENFNSDFNGNVFISNFRRGKDITELSLGSETNEDDISTNESFIFFDDILEELDRGSLPDPNSGGNGGSLIPNSGGNDDSLDPDLEGNSNIFAF